MNNKNKQSKYLCSCIEEAESSIIPNNNTRRFGYNGMEKDDEVKGLGTSYDYGTRFLDPRLGRFLSLDPYKQKYPYVTPYNYVENDPITRIDANGKKWEIKNWIIEQGELKLNIVFTAVLLNNNLLDNEFANEFINSMKEQISTSFTSDFIINKEQQELLSKDFGTNIPNKIRVVTTSNIRIVQNNKDINPYDHIISIFDPYKDINKLGSGEEAEFLGRRIFLSSARITQIALENDPRTVVHGLGHTLGLLHPNKLDNRTNGQYFTEKSDPDNDNSVYNAMFEFGYITRAGFPTRYYYFNTPQFVRMIDNIKNDRVNQNGDQPRPGESMFDDQ